MSLNRVALAAFLAACQAKPQEPSDVAEQPSGGIQRGAVTSGLSENRAELAHAASLLHLEANGPHCSGTAENFSGAQVIETPNGPRLKIGRGHYLIKRISDETGRRVVWVRSTADSPSGTCWELGLDGVAENDVDATECTNQ